VRFAKPFNLKLLGHAKRGAKKAPVALIPSFLTANDGTDS